jgi:butyrate kinase
MLVETLQAINSTITKLASLPQLQQNQNFTNLNGPQTANQINLNHETQFEEQNLINNHVGSANTPEFEQSPVIPQYDPLKSRIDRVET